MHISTIATLLSHLSLLPLVVSVPTRKTPEIVWADCPKTSAPGLDCGTIKVPIDYNEPSGDTVTLFIARLKANGTSRIGNLLFNPGGPGGSGSQTVIDVARRPSSLFSPKLLANYDIIGLDPRGVGQSSPIQCDPEIFNRRVSIFPKTEADFVKLADHNKEFGASCKQKSGPLFDHMDTTSTAKDFELVRQALGEGKLNFLTFSYGTLIATAYAELYPEQIGRMALDGITDHSNSDITSLSSETLTFELTLNKFFQWCSTTTDCVLSKKDAATVFDNVIQAADAKPIPAPGCVGSNLCRIDTNAEEILINVKNMLESPAGFPIVAFALDEASQGNSTRFSQSLISDSTSPFFSAQAVFSQDWPPSAQDFTDLSVKKQLLQTVAPHTRGISQTLSLLMGSINFPSTLTNPPHVLNSRVKDAPPILLVNSLWDPATSIEWANNVRSQIPHSVLIVRNGVGHLSYPMFGQTSAAVDDFLVDGKLPVQGTTYDS
jgi:pimeloyl-ACP methyl ester carboxylesterase